MFGLGKKKSKGYAPPEGGMGIPTQKVVSLSSQGMSEPEIIRKLREEGHSPLEVDRAMKEAMRSGAGSRPAAPAPPGPAAQRPVPAAPTPPMPQAPAPPEPGPPAAPPDDLDMDEPPMTQEEIPPRGNFMPTDWGNDDDLDDIDMGKLPKERRLGPDSFMAGMDEKLPPPPEERQPLPFAKPPLPKEKDDRIRELKDRRRREIEELTEEITEEKWQELMKRVGALEGDIEKLSMNAKNSPAQTAGSVPEEFNSLKREIDSQKESIEETNARIDSLEEVVKGSLTPMLDSVKKLNRIAKPASHAASATQHEPKTHPMPSAKEPESGEPPRYSPEASKK